jgi:hypothetical protein
MNFKHSLKMLSAILLGIPNLDAEFTFCDSASDPTPKTHATDGERRIAAIHTAND